jgi:hypothetical protein
MRSIPIAFRPLLRKRVHKKGKASTAHLPYYLDRTFLTELGLARNLAIAEFVDIEKINAPDILSRVLSVEMLLRDTLSSA